MNNNFTDDRYYIKNKDDNYIIYVNGYGTEILIPKEFDANDYENIGYQIVDKKEYIDDLIRWISESDNEINKESMKIDLKNLMKDEKHDYILVSFNTNEILFGDENDYNSFNNIIEKIITSEKVAKANKNNKSYKYFIEAEKNK